MQKESEKSSGKDRVTWIMSINKCLSNVSSNTRPSHQNSKKLSRDTKLRRQFVRAILTTVGFLRKKCPDEPSPVLRAEFWHAFPP